MPLPLLATLGLNYYGKNQVSAIERGSSKAGFLALDVALVFLQDAPMSLFLPSGETSL